MNRPGIYRLQFPSGHYYIGSSKDYVTRCHQHQNNMKRGAHDSIRVQRVYDKYGELPVYGLVLGCSLENLQSEEQKQLDEHVGKPVCLNIGRCAEAARRGVKGDPHSKERREYMRDKMRKRVFTDEHRKRISEAKKGKPINATRTPEANAKRSASLKGRAISPETRAAISKALTGHKPAHSKAVVLKNTGQVFESAMLAERSTGASAVGRACKRGFSAGKMPNGEPMRWEFVFIKTCAGTECKDRWERKINKCKEIK